MIPIQTPENLKSDQAIWNQPKIKKILLFHRLARAKRTRHRTVVPSPEVI
jgi:hypothetical protein